MKNVFIAGSFDLLHLGHLYLLKEASKLGHVIVAINHDAYFKKKGPNRPVDNLNKRISNVFQTGLVDEIYAIEDSPLALILKLKPDYIVVGNDYDESRIVGAKECLTWGGKVVIVPRIKELSTTKIIESLVKNEEVTTQMAFESQRELEAAAFTHYL